MPPGPQLRNPSCCACNRKGLCLRCVCVKNGKRCVSCFPSRLGTCSNRESSSSQPKVPAALSQPSAAVQHAPLPASSASFSFVSSLRHSPPRAQNPGSTNSPDHEVSPSRFPSQSDPVSSQGDLVNDVNLPSPRSSAIPDLDSIFRPKLPTLQHVPKGARSAWASLLSDLCSDISKDPLVL